MSGAELGSLTAGNLTLVAAAAIFLLVVAMGTSRRPESAVHLYRWIAVPQAAIMVALALRLRAPLLGADAVVTLAVKGVWIPFLLRRRLVRPSSDFGLSVTASPALLLGGAAAVAVLGLRLGAVLVPSSGLALGLLLAAMVLGFGAPCIRTELWPQVAGILGGEGALAASLLILVGGLPVLAEVLALAEVVVLAAVLTLIVGLVHEVHGSPDARLLERLRG